MLEDKERWGDGDEETGRKKDGRKLKGQEMGVLKANAGDTNVVRCMGEQSGRGRSETV